MPLPATQTVPAWYSTTQLFNIIGELVKGRPITVTPEGSFVLDTLYNLDGSSAPNPLPVIVDIATGIAGGADPNGNLQFGASAGFKDLWSDGNYVGTVELSAADTDTMHLHGAETAHDIKTFADPIHANGSPPVKLPAGTAGQVLTSDASGNLSLQPPTGGAGAATVASREQLQTVDNVALRQFRAALANRFNARCNVCVVGDSIWEGQGATSLPVRGVNRLAAQLRNRFPVFGVAGGQGYLPAYFAGATPTLPAPATLVGAPGQAADFGPGFRNFALAGTQTVTFTVVGTSCDVVFAKGSGAGTMGVSIDGGTVTSINTTAGATADGSLQRFVFANQGTHTVAISAVSGTAFIDGLIIYNQDENAGITVHDCSHSGYHLSDFSGANQTNLAAWLAALAPSLVIVALGVNDYNAQSPLATFAANITTLLNTIKGLTPKPSILFHIDYDPFNVGPITWPQYVSQIYTTVGSDPAVAILDASLRMPGSQTTPNYGLYYTDNVHPSAIGHSLLAENVLAEVSPR